MSAPAIIPFASDLATRIRAEHDAAQSAMRSAVGHAVEAGKLLMEAKKSVPHGGWEAWVRDSCGFSERTAQGYMRLARLAPEEAQRVALLSLRDALKALAEPKSEPAPLSWSGAVEWYTPPEIVEAARQVMGRIDLDPASCAKAQEVIQARRFFTEEQDGLDQKWRGRVWLNPPYASGEIDKFVAKLVTEHTTGNVPEAVLLVHSRTDTAWFHEAASVAAAICFARGRVRFQRPDGTGDAPPIGSAFLYFGAAEVSGRFAQTCGNLPPDIARPRRWRQDATVTGGPQPKVLVLKLRQRVSARGNTYLDGRMGQAKLIGFKDAEPDQYGNETWSIYAVTPQPKGERT